MGSQGSRPLAPPRTPPVQVKQAMIEELRRGPRLLPAEQRSVDDAAAALEHEAQELLVSAGGAHVPA